MPTTEYISELVKLSPLKDPTFSEIYAHLSVEFRDKTTYCSWIGQIYEFHKKYYSPTQNYVLRIFWTLFHPMRRLKNHSISMKDLMEMLFPAKDFAVCSWDQVISCWLPLITMLKTPDITTHPITLYWQWASQSCFLALASQCQWTSQQLQNTILKSLVWPSLMVFQILGSCFNL